MTLFNKNVKFYFSEPRLKFSIFSDFLYRFISSVFFILLICLCFVLLLSDISNLKFLGIFILLFLIDRIFHLNEGERALWEIEKSFKEKFNLADFLNQKAKNILIYSYQKTKVLKSNFYLIFLKEILKEKEINEIFKKLEIDKDLFLKKIDEFLLNSKTESLEDLNLKIFKLTEESFKISIDLKEKFIYLRNLLVGLLKVEDKDVLNLFEFFNINAIDLQLLNIYIRFYPKFRFIKNQPSFLSGFAKHYFYKSKNFYMNLAWTAKSTPFLDNFSEDLTYLAKKEKIGFLIGHQKEFERLLNIVSKDTKPNVLLIGEPSSGKTTIVNHFAYALTHEKVPSNIFDKRLVKLDLSLILANATPEIITFRLNKIIEEVLQAKNIILYLPDFDKYAKSVQANVILPLDILLPLLKNDQIPIVAEANLKEFKQFLENRSDVLELFEIIKVEEISEEEALKFLIFSSLILERKFKIKISFTALKKCVKLAKMYFRERLLPSSADELLKQAFSFAKENKIKVIKEELILDLAQQKTNVPLKEIDALEKEKLLNLEAIIHKNFINQDYAVKAVSNALREYKAGLKRSSGPIAAFLFVGPTGVGKTELAKILARIEFGLEEKAIRFDMSEFQEKNSISRFLGAEGNVNSLTSLVYDNPYSLILLDEFEKAHPDILNLFLQIFDDGRLTDYNGRLVDFKNTIIIATSNAHSDFIKEALDQGKSIEEISEELKKKITSIFRPELINRFTDIVVFRSLNLEEIFQIAKLQLNNLAKNLKDTRGIEINFSEDVIKKIASLGYDKIYGARPLRKVVNYEIKSVLAEKILKDELKRGDKINVVLENDVLKFIKAN